MKLAIIEPLNVAEDRLNQLLQPLYDQGHQVDIYSDLSLDPEVLYQRAKDAEIVIIANHPLPGSVIRRLDKTQLINVAFTGLDHVDLEAAKAKGIKVANASGYAGNAVAELAIGLTLALYRQIKQSDLDVRQGPDFPGLIQGQEIAGKTVGIIGTGSLGLKTAKLYQAFGANLIGYSRTEKPEAKDMGLVYRPIEEVMAQSDIISIHLPLTQATKGLINKDLIGKMKPSAILINIARGAILDNQALAQALNEDKIAGAGIDVYDTEPPLAADNPILNAKHTILTPHIGYLTDEAMIKRAKIVIDNALAFIEGREENIVSL